MKTTPRYLILLFIFFFIASCQNSSIPGTNPPILTESPRSTAALRPTFSAVPFPSRTSPSPASDSGKITPGNASQLVQLKQLGAGWARGSPLFTPDGRWLLAPTSTGIIIYDTSTYQNGRVLAPVSGFVDNLAISPDGTTLAIGDRLISIQDGHELPGLDIPSSIDHGENAIHSVRQAKFSPNGEILALVSTNDKIGLWRLADGELLHTFQGESLEFSLDGHKVVTVPDLSTEDPHIYLYDTQSGDLLQDWPGEMATFLPGNRLAVEALGSVRVYDLGTGKVPVAFNGSHAAFSPDGRFIAFLLFDQVWVYSLMDGKLVSQPEGNFVGVDELNLQFSSDGQTLAGQASWGFCCGGNKTLLSLWRVTSGELLHEANRRDFAFSQDGGTFVSGIEIWDIAAGENRGTLQGFLSGSISGLAFLEDGKELIVHAGDRLLSYRIERDKLKRNQPADVLLPVDPLIGLPAGEIGWPGPDFWRSNVEKSLDPDLLEVLKRMSFEGTGAAFSPDGKWVATSDGDTLQLWDSEEQSTAREIKVCTEQMVSSLAFSPDGKQLALACARSGSYTDQFVQVWQVGDQWRLLKDLQAEYPGQGYTELVYSPDGKILAAAGDQVDLWDPLEGICLSTLEPEIEFFRSDPGVVSMAFSPDGELLALGMLEGQVELWDTRTGQRLARLPKFDFQPVQSVAFSPDGELLAAGLGDGSVRLWGLAER